MRAVSAGRMCIAAFALLAPFPAFADQAPPASGLRLDNWGVYAVRTVGGIANAGNTSGVQDVVREPALVLKTHDVCAALGTTFGLRFSLSGPGAAPLDVTVEITIRA